MSQPDPAGITLQAAVDLTAAIGNLTTEMRAQRDRIARRDRAIHYLEVGLPPITAASATLDKSDLMGPRTGMLWDVKSITMAAFTGGTVQVFKGPADLGTNLKFTFTQAGINTYGKGQLIVQAGDRLVMVSNAAFTGTAIPSIAVFEMESWLLPDYLV